MTYDEGGLDCSKGQQGSQCIETEQCGLDGRWRSCAASHMFCYVLLTATCSLRTPQSGCEFGQQLVVNSHDVDLQLVLFQPLGMVSVLLIHPLS